MHTVDIKVLRAVHILITCGSVTKAAEILNVTPGAVTYLLNKARKATGSALFFRTKNGMLPDNVAKELSLRYKKFAGEFSESNQKLSLGDRDITISTYALIELLIGIHSKKSNSNGKINFSPLPMDDDTRLIKLRNREVDIDIGTRLSSDKSIIQCTLFSSKVKIVARKNNPHINDILSIDSWLNSSHITWTRGMHLLSPNHLQANKFHEMMSRRKIYCESSNSVNMIMMAAFTDHLILMPELIIKYFEDKLPIVAYDIPEDIDVKYECYVHYHCSMAKEQMIRSILEDLHNAFSLS
ncbi:LysR family transcriptional regulator [Scandinavium goeteborgense]|uniref:DNA-binding transcriptional LysR family regulator n=1 Tax=Scandinavium goeteborgense TaxID=1851514 RepID=A0A4R6E2I1_SCAGO|nr:LysR family transcriptional regulator [Scandinavium goeteborgense]TDN51524.1 DNA-binding transcriptional LysR family regulator [Scandinavium goeteborgense]